MYIVLLKQFIFVLFSVDAVDMVESDDVCNPEITGGDSGRLRRKRSWSAATMASWKINWCTSKKVLKSWFLQCFGIVTDHIQSLYLHLCWFIKKNTAYGRQRIFQPMRISRTDTILERLRDLSNFFYFFVFFRGQRLRDFSQKRKKKNGKP